MQIGINTWVWTSPLTTAEFTRLAPRVAQMGFDLIEVPIEGTDDIDYRSAADIARSHGLAVSVCAAMGPDRDLVHPDSAIRENGMRYLQHCIEAVGLLGGRNLVGPLYSAVGRTWQATDDERRADLDVLVGQLRRLAAVAGDHGVTLGVEPLNRFETSFINLATQVVDVVDRVDHDACGIMLDTFHMNIEESSLGDAIRLAGRRLCHLHACENDRGTPGSGHVPWDEVARACRDIGFEGPLVIESFTNQVKTIARAAAIWRPLASSQDALAEGGLKYLRALLSSTPEIQDAETESV
jgi:D-psicose/D-tagatose/L-ribulose 3-epimerase